MRFFGGGWTLPGDSSRLATHPREDPCASISYGKMVSVGGGVVLRVRGDRDVRLATDTMTGHEARRDSVADAIRSDSFAASSDEELKREGETRFRGDAVGFCVCCV